MNAKPILDTDLILHEGRFAFHIGLESHQIPQRIITVGDPDRVERVSRHFEHIDFKIQKREFVSHRGTYRGKDILVISTGIGVDNVEIVMTEIDALVNVDLQTRIPKSSKQKLHIVRVGTSGSLQSDIPVGSEVASSVGIGFDNLRAYYVAIESTNEAEITKSIQSKTGLTFRPYMASCSTLLFNQIGYDMIKGNTATCPGFYSPQGRSVRLEITYPSLLNDLSEFKSGDFRITNFEMETATLYFLGGLMGHEMLSINGIIVNRIQNKMSENPEEVIGRLIKKILERI